MKPGDKVLCDQRLAVIVGEFSRREPWKRPTKLLVLVDGRVRRVRRSLLSMLTPTGGAA